MEETLIFKNGRQPQFFPNGRLPQFGSRQPRELNLRMQHCFNQNRCNMEEDLIFFRNGRQPKFFENER